MNKNFIVNHSFSEGFNETMSDLLKKYGDTIFEIQGISNNSMDIVKFSKKFFKSASSSVANTTVDGNANVSERNAVNYHSENNKSLMRLNSLYLLYKYIEEIYGTEYAKVDIERIINGEIFVNDLHLLSIPYCFAFDICDLLVSGMDFFNGNMEIHAPKNPDSFMALTIQTTAYISNQIAGAIAYPSFFVALDYMYRKEFTDDYILHRNMITFRKRIENQFQNLIYSLNFPFRSGVQSAFTNLSVLDSGFMESLFSGYVYPDGSSINKNSVIELSKWFFEYYTKINCSEGMFTFPVMTLAISLDENGEYIDKDFVDWCAEANSEKSLANIFIDIPTSFSSCCFTGNTNTLVCTTNGIHKLTFEEIDKLSCNDKNNLKVFHCGNWIPIKQKIVKTGSFDKNLITITTANNKSFTCTKDHIFPTLNGDKCAKDISKNDYLLFSNSVTPPISGRDKGLTYNDGLLIGAYLGDGSTDVKKTCNSITTTLSLNASKIYKLRDILIDWRINEQKHNVVSASTSNKEISYFIKEYVSGNYSYEKRLNLDALAQSIEFRQGIIDGYYITDGGNSNRIYTTSKELIFDMEALFTSLGYFTIINEDDRREDIRQFRDEPTFSPNYIVYCIKWYSRTCKISAKDIFVKKFNQFYFKVKSIMVSTVKDEFVYCFETRNQDEPYFTLPNGIVTHNCRLRSDLKTINSNGYQNSFGVGGVKVGSLRVAGINLPRLAYENLMIEDALDSIHRILFAQRTIIKERIDSGFMPLYTTGWMSLNKQYSTIGFVGANEYIDLCYENSNISPINKLHGELSKIELKIKSWQETDGCMYNVEQIPAESMAVRLAEVDRELGLNDKYKLYSNQYISLMKDIPIYDRFVIQGHFDKLTTGGAILHLNVDDNKPMSKIQFKRLIDTAQSTGTKYFGVNYAFSVCEKKHYSTGDNDLCPVCNSLITDKYTRVVGFLTSVKNWVSVRRDFEFPNRVFYNNSQIFDYSN